MIPVILPIVLVQCYPTYPTSKRRKKNRKCRKVAENVFKLQPLHENKFLLNYCIFGVSCQLTSYDLYSLFSILISQGYAVKNCQFRRDLYEIGESEMLTSKVKEIDLFALPRLRIL